MPTGPLTWLLGVWLSLTILENLVKQDQQLEPIYPLGTLMIIAGFIGARLTHVLLNWPNYAHNLTEIVWPITQGFVWWGGLLIGGLAGLFYGRAKKLPFWFTLDVLTPFFLIGLLTASLADFLAGSRLGETTTVPWSINLFGLRRHAVQLYEVAGALVAFVLWWRVWRVGWRNGRSFLIAFSLYSAIYTWVNAYGETNWLTTEGYRIPQLISFVAMMIFLITLAVRSEVDPPPAEHLVPQTATSPPLPDNETPPSPIEENADESQG